MPVLTSKTSRSYCKLDFFRSRIADQKLAPEEICVDRLMRADQRSESSIPLAETSAAALVEAVRAKRTQQSLLDAFLQEFGFSNEEGIALMCLAEALLRVPDDGTADELIADKIASGNWSDHVGHAESAFVNASTWALMLTGQVISLDQSLTKNPASWLGKLVNRMGEPVIRNAMHGAMRILGREFVLGRTIEEAISRGASETGRKGIFSFDMLGEGARDRQSAEAYFQSYAHAIKVIAERNSKADVVNGSGISVKLSALHPRYEFAQTSRVMEELGARLLGLARLAADANIGLSIDAEEMDRLDLSLDLFEMVAMAPDLKDWQGLGLVVQAYGKRAPRVIDWVIELARLSGRRIPVRLVKGAYWDSEIKHAQELGLSDFPVFTRKVNTDLSYLICAQMLLRNKKYIYSQFATHNAHTLAAIMTIADGADDFEFQRLHGMGELLYEVAAGHYSDFPKVRVYAPVGGHKDLLAYLVRRLLENGANSSFVNRFMDADIDPIDLVKDPKLMVETSKTVRHPQINLPSSLLGDGRRNSGGVDLTSALDMGELMAQVSQYADSCERVSPIVYGVDLGGAGEKVFSPSNGKVAVGRVEKATHGDVDRAFGLAARHQPAWDALGGEARADLLDAAANELESQLAKFVALLIREAGKTIPDAIAEIREAVDFCRYYAGEARRHFGGAINLPGPTGEHNALSLHGRGVFVCISPWNFPLAIFMGQVAAALAAGNTVLAKPAQQTPLVAAAVVKLLHETGVPVNVLQFLPGGAEVGQWMTAHRQVSGLAFTGSTMTALSINRALAGRDGPIAPLIAETGGQNVMFADSTALIEQLTDDVVQSAFLSAGQRCSALRVLYVQEEIADQAIEMICGAMDELHVGDPALLHTDVGPVIDQAAAERLHTHILAMTEIAKRVHVTPLSDECAHGTYIAPHLFEIDSIGQLDAEQFGPILHIIRYRAEDLEHHVAEAQSTGYGLTLGVHTRIESRAQKIFQQSSVGNTYVNRNMVGAVVGVQPFGGQGLSGTGPKAGGPHYLLRFATEKTLTINTMAAGGNADLLRLEETDSS